MHQNARMWAAWPVALLVCCAAATTTEADGPAEAVRAFAQALAQGDTARAEQMIAVGPRGNRARVASQVKRLVGRSRPEVQTVHQAGDVAVVVAFEPKAGAMGGMRDYDPIYLLRDRGGWKLLPEITRVDDADNGLTDDQVKAFAPVVTWYQRWKVRQRLLDAGMPADEQAVEAGLKRERERQWFNAFSNPDRMRQLLLEGADINARNENGQTALHLAATFGMAHGARFLIESGADIHARSAITGATPLMMAAGSMSADTVELLIRKGADVNAKVRDGRTVLHMAAAAGRASAVRLLLDAGAGASAKESSGKTPLDYARGRQQVEDDPQVRAVIELLEKVGPASRPGGAE